MDWAVDYGFLVLAAFFTSTLTAALGLGGGVLLLAIMSFYIPFAAAIPLHGVVQLASNVSRFGVDMKSVRWECVGIYAIGSVLGVLAGYFYIDELTEEYLPVFLGIFILVITWKSVLKFFHRWLSNLGLVAFIQSFLSLFVGSTGLLSPPILIDKGLMKDEVIVTHAVQMSIMHLMKIVAFMLTGFSLLNYSLLLFGMIVTSIIGSWVGGKIRKKIKEGKGRKILKVLLTLLALKMIISAF